MRVGPYDIHSITAGALALDGGAMFGVVPKPLWQKRIGVDDRNRIDMRMRCLVIRDEQKTILVDTAIGNNWSEKEIDIYRIDHSTFALEPELAKIGVQPTDVTDVILTHLHFDHVGGAVTKQSDGTLTPTFANATYYSQKTQLDWAQQPTAKDQGSFRACDIAPLLAAKQLTVIEGPQELFPGIRLQLTQGHTSGMQHPIISDGETTLFYAADLFPTSVHLPLPWIMAYDVRPLITVEEKQSVLSQAADNNWIVAFEHCPHMAAGTIQKTEKGFALGKTITLA